MSNNGVPVKPKRKKTARACQNCHKAHMTCDEGRPCKRCVIRNLQESCIDAPRKRKKYLIDVPEDLSNPPVPVTPEIKDEIKRDFFIPKDHQTSKFMSNAANNEYSILSDIIKQDYQYYNTSISESTVSPPNNHHDSISKLRHASSHPMNSRTSTPTPSSSISQHDIYNVHKQSDKSINQYKLGNIQDQLITYPDAMKLIDGDLAISEPNDLINNTTTKLINKPALSFSIAINDNSEMNSPSMESNNGLRFKEPEDIYAKINKAFSYTPGFHSLIQYLRQRFNPKDLIKMAKSMASYRPSFIACTNTLKEEDLIFMEQCFQRTLLEYDKFISISGTPTIVWRRTGQISYVSEEFSILTGWAKDNLLNKVTFIVELMDDNSVIEYFDLFSTIAYGDFKAATMGSCTLLTPDNSRIKTTCIWTLKRDVFGIPMMIIGNFLPIL